MKSKSTVKQGVILAAGRGSRIFPLSKKTPKPMLRVLGKPIIEYQIEAMRKAGIVDIIIVVGFLGGKIKKYFGSGKKFGVNIVYLNDSAPKGIASSLLLTREKINGPFMCFLGDIFVAPKGLVDSLSRMIKAGEKNVLLVKTEPNRNILRLHAEVVADGNLVKKLIEKPKNPKSGLRTCGIYLFTEDIFEAISKTPKSALRGEIELTDAIDKLISLGKSVYFEKLRTWDINVTYEADLETCEQLLKRDLGTELS